MAQQGLAQEEEPLEAPLLLLVGGGVGDSLQHGAPGPGPQVAVLPGHLLHGAVEAEAALPGGEPVDGAPALPRLLVGVEGHRARDDGVQEGSEGQPALLLLPAPHPPPPPPLSPPAPSAGPPRPPSLSPYP